MCRDAKFMYAMWEIHSLGLYFVHRIGEKKIKVIQIWVVCNFGLPLECKKKTR